MSEGDEEREGRRRKTQHSSLNYLTFNFQTVTMRLMRLTSPTDAKNRSSVTARRRAAWRERVLGFGGRGRQKTKR